MDSPRDAREEPEEQPAAVQEQVAAEPSDGEAPVELPPPGAAAEAAGEEQAAGEDKVQAMSRQLSRLSVGDLEHSGDGEEEGEGDGEGPAVGQEELPAELSPGKANFLQVRQVRSAASGSSGCCYGFLGACRYHVRTYSYTCSRSG
jgi:hypothetical protein